MANVFPAKIMIGTVEYTFNGRKGHKGRYCPKKRGGKNKAQTLTLEEALAKAS